MTREEQVKKVKEYYAAGLWSKSRVEELRRRGKLSEEEYAEVIGE